VQLGTQRVVAGHRLLDCALEQHGLQWAGQVDIAADVVERRIALAQLVEPDVL
jgi:hypothetical protein